MTSKLVMRLATLTAGGAVAVLSWTGGIGGSAAVAAIGPALIPVPCSAAALSFAITTAPPFSTLLLAPACPYLLAGPLPDITTSLTFVGNFAAIAMTGTGTIVTVDHAKVTFRDLVFTGGSGTGTDPGAVLNDGGTLALATTTFIGNSGGEGSAVQNTGSGKLTIVNSAFIHNTASLGGAVANLGDATIIVNGTSFTSNTQTTSGTFVGGAALFLLGDGVVTSQFGDTFRDNTAAGTGGAIFDGGDLLTMANASFSGNQSSSSGGGAVRVALLGTGSFTRTSFTGNTSTIGGAISATSTVNLGQVTMSGNHATQRGGGLFIDGHITTVADHTTITHNVADVAGGGIYLNNGTVILTGGSTVTANTPDNCVNVTC